MILEPEMKQQLAQYLELLEGEILLKVSTDSDKTSKDMVALVDELASMSSKITIEHTVLERTPSFSVNRPDEDTGIVFAGLPLGQGFTSLFFAFLKLVEGDQRMTDEVKNQMEQLNNKHTLESTLG